MTTGPAPQSALTRPATSRAGQRQDPPVSSAQSRSSSARQEPSLTLLLGLGTLTDGTEGHDPSWLIVVAVVAACRVGGQAVLPAELDSDWTYEPSSFRREAVDGEMLRRIGLEGYEDDL